MANKKISELPAISTFSGVEPLAVVQGGETRKATINQVVALWPSYTGDDAPGTGVNILADGKSRVWNHTTGAKSYLITNVGGTYKAVEMATWSA